MADVCKVCNYAIYYFTPNISSEHEETILEYNKLIPPLSCGGGLCTQTGFLGSSLLSARAMGIMSSTYSVAIFVRTRSSKDNLSFVSLCLDCVEKCPIKDKKESARLLNKHSMSIFSIVFRFACRAYESRSAAS